MKGVEFRSLKIPRSYGKVINNIFFVIDNGRSVIEAFNDLGTEQKDSIKHLICKMATELDFSSPQIKYTLSNYAYGEITPKAHRFFFFRKCGKNYVFFGYNEKKTNSLPDKVYKRLERRMKIYEKEFKRFNCRI